MASRTAATVLRSPETSTADRHADRVVQVILAAGADGYVTDADTPRLIDDVNDSVGQVVGLDQPVFDGVDILLPGAEGAVGQVPDVLHVGTRTLTGETEDRVLVDDPARQVRSCHTRGLDSRHLDLALGFDSQ